MAELLAGLVILLGGYFTAFILRCNSVVGFRCPNVPQEMHPCVMRLLDTDRREKFVDPLGVRALTQQVIAITEAVELHKPTHEVAHVGGEHLCLLPPFGVRFVVVDDDSARVAIDVKIVAFRTVLRVDDECV